MVVRFLLPDSAARDFFFEQSAHGMILIEPEQPLAPPSPEQRIPDADPMEAAAREVCRNESTAHAGESGLSRHSACDLVIGKLERGVEPLGDRPGQHLELSPELLDREGAGALPCGMAAHPVGHN